MDQLFERIKGGMEKRIALEPIDIPGELAQVNLPDGSIDMKCYNFSGEGVRKVYFMRVKVKPSPSALAVGFPALIQFLS